MQIFVVTKRLDFIRSGELADALQMHLDADEIILVVPPELFTAAKDMTYSCNLICVVDEVEILGFPLSEVAKWNVDEFPDRAGWYYQQLIKLAVAESRFARERYVIWDADTIPYHRISTFDGDKLLFTRGYEFHLSYFDTNERLVGINRTRGPRFSAISQHMPVDRAIMREMLQHIGRNSNGGSWVAAIKAALLNRQGGTLFSEYELFADWTRTRYPDRFVLRHLPWLREGAILSKPEIAIAKKLASFIAFEYYHSARGKKLRHHVKCWIRLISRRAGVYSAVRGLYISLINSDDKS